MPKPESWRLDRASYPYSYAVQTRFSDMDMLGHINNVKMAELFETGRMAFNHSLDVVRRENDQRWLIASVALDYVAEAHVPEPVDVATGIGRVGSASWDLYSAAFQEAGCVATCITTIVLTDKNGPVAIPDPLRACFEANAVRRA